MAPLASSADALVPNTLESSVLIETGYRSSRSASSSQPVAVGCSRMCDLRSVNRLLVGQSSIGIGSARKKETWLGYSSRAWPRREGRNSSIAVISASFSISAQCNVMGRPTARTRSSEGRKSAKSPRAGLPEKSMPTISRRASSRAARNSSASCTVSSARAEGWARSMDSIRRVVSGDRPARRWVRSNSARASSSVQTYPCASESASARGVERSSRYRTPSWRKSSST
mmetsp:Transcript_13616/g.34695  ORF Transcript_13616/g.34695 Transcript_13616/m.34695 type:complete len:228 (+) Transcript_13616:249-932(+)